MMDTVPTIQFQERDGAAVRAIYDFDGVLAKPHLKVMFWPDAVDDRALERRLSLLVRNGYVSRPSQLDWRTRSIPEPIYWLGWRGVFWIAGQEGVQVEPPKEINETQLRLFAVRLRERGIHWLRQPRWSQLAHDLAVNDVRVAVLRSLKSLPDLSLETWVTESAFRRKPDVVAYRAVKRGGEIHREEREVIPDGCFVMRDGERAARGEPARARFLLELDKGTHDQLSFGTEKVAQGLAYLRSEAYKRRFGSNSGRFLVVTTGQVRMRNLMERTKTVAGKDAYVFLFATLDQVTVANVLADPIWWQPGQDKPKALSQA